MIDRQHPLPVVRQAKALGMSHASIYDPPRLVGEADLGLMRRMGVAALYRKRSTSRPAPGP